MEKTVSGNNETCAFWQAMDNTIAATIPFAENYAARIKEYRDALTRLVDQKQRNILSPVQLTEADEVILNIAGELNTAMAEYNKAVDTANAKIAAIKAQHVTLDELKQQHANNVAILKAQCNEGNPQLCGNQVVYLHAGAGGAEPSEFGNLHQAPPSEKNRCDLHCRSGID